MGQAQRLGKDNVCLPAGIEESTAKKKKNGNKLCCLKGS